MPGITLNGAVVADEKFGAEATRVKRPASLMVRVLNAATPLAFVTAVFAPPGVTVPSLPPIEMLIGILGTGTPSGPSARTVTVGEIGTFWRTQFTVPLNTLVQGAGCATKTSAAIPSGGAIPRVSSRVATCCIASTTRTVNVNAPAVVGVPLISPEDDSVSPGGRSPLTKFHVREPEPPLALSCPLDSGIPTRPEANIVVMIVNRVVAAVGCVIPACASAVSTARLTIEAFNGWPPISTSPNMLFDMSPLVLCGLGTILITLPSNLSKSNTRN